MEDREVTPPHHPTHGIHLSHEEIGKIVQVCLLLPSTNYILSRLARGKSFNNRIYYINNIDDSQPSYVLKVNGHYWGPAKVENETRCLDLLQKFCPDVPAPRVIAWSTDGGEINRPCKDLQESDWVDISCKKGWILMSRLPGEPIDPQRLSAEDALLLSAQLSEMIHSWRSQILRSDRCGNLCPRATGVVSNASFKRNGLGLDLGLDIQGILDIDMPPSHQPIYSLFNYWDARLRHALRKLTEEPVYSANRQSLEPVLSQFIDKNLPHLSMFERSPRETSGFVFSHTDFAPRNVLIQGSPPRITGIVDFEFSGFFPCLREFTGTSQEADDEAWPAAMLERILQDLEDRGSETPLRWKGLKRGSEWVYLDQLETNIAPWWLSGNDVPVSEVLSELAKAKIKVQAILSALQDLEGST